MKLSSVGEVLDFAISGEIKAQELYTNMAAMAENLWLQTALEDIAQDERRHQRKLVAVRKGRVSLPTSRPEDLGLADMLDDVEPHPDMTYPELLAFAIKKEHSANQLYDTLATAFPKPELKDLFRKLAAEEAEHKRRFELQYEQLTS
jgi:rubrerythrin